MFESSEGHPPVAERESMELAESADYWRHRSEKVEARMLRLLTRLRYREQRILLLEKALIRTVALHHELEEHLERRLDQSADTEAARERTEHQNTAGTGQPNAGVLVHLPHLTRTLAALFEIMREHWSDWDPERPPKSSVVARAIDMKLGLKGQASGEASRNAQTFAAALRPDSANETDARHR
jgi:hypothetical protein